MINMINTKTVLLKGKYLEYGGRRADIVFVNEHLLEILKSGNFNDLGAYPVVGDCLTPLVFDGDLIIVADNAPVRDGDIVVVEAKGEIFGSRYRDDGDNIWLSSAHGKRSLDGCLIIGTAMVIGRFPRESIKRGGKEFILLPVLTEKHLIHNTTKRGAWL